MIFQQKPTLLVVDKTDFLLELVCVIFVNFSGEGTDLL